MNKRCIECFVKQLKDPAHRINNVNCINCNNEVIV